MTLLTLVHTCLKYESLRARIIDETWAKDLDDFYFISDSEAFSLSRSINLGPYSPGPTYHPSTLMRIFRLFKSHKFRKYQWLFLVDDDSYCYPKKLKQFLGFFDPSDAFMMGDYLNWPTFHKFHKSDYRSWIGGGPGIVFSRPAVNLLEKWSRTVRAEVENHDVWLHNLIAAEGSYRVKQVHIPGFHQYGARELWKRFDRSSGSLISVHMNGNMRLFRRYHDRM